jgi:hypothetical protein
VSLFCLITFNNYWITSLYFSFASFCGAWILVKQIIGFSPSAKNVAMASFLFFPSVVFWSSGLIKESLAMASLFFLCSLFVKAWQRKTPGWIEYLFLIVSLWVLWNLKYYYLAVLVPQGFGGRIAVATQRTAGAERLRAAGADLVFLPFQDAADRAVDLMLGGEPPERALDATKAEEEREEVA